MLGYPKNLQKQTYYVLQINFRQLIFTSLTSTLLTLNKKSVKNVVNHCICNIVKAQKNKTLIIVRKKMTSINWTSEFDRFLGTIGNFESPQLLELDGQGHKLKCDDKEHKGKVYYLGEQRNNTHFGDYPFITVRTHAHGGETLGVFDGYDILKGDYTPHIQTPAQIQAAKAKVDAAKLKNENDAKAKAANVQGDIERFSQLSKTPTQSQNQYLTDKNLTDFLKLTDCDIRYGTDKHGQFAAILLIDAITNTPAGVQRFYDRKIKKSDSNKDFTWGMSKTGACYQLGSIDNTTPYIAFCEGFADAVVTHIVRSCPVIVTLDANNIGHVTSAYKSKYPNVHGLVVTDNDAHKLDRMDNVGVLKGVAAAQKNGYQFVIPDFTSYDQSEKPTDLWDLWQLGGNKAVEQLFNNVQTPPTQDEWAAFELPFLQVKSIQEKSSNTPFVPTPKCQKPLLSPAPVTPKVIDNNEEKRFCPFWHSKTPIRFFEQQTTTQEVTEKMLPTKIKGWIMDVAKRMQTPPTFSAVAAINFISSVIARRVTIAPMRYNKEWVVYPNLWGAIIGKAGSQKSPSITPMFEPIRKHDKAQRDLYKIDLEHWEYEVEQCKKNKADQSEYPEKPIQQALYSNDATVEALQKIHADNPQGLLVYRDEFGGFIETLTKQGREGSRQFFLEGWNGDGTFSYDTVSRGNTYINGLSLSLFGSIQPSVLAKQIEGAISGKTADGFIQRFQMLVKSAPHADYDIRLADVEPDYQAKQDYHDVFERLLNLPVDNPININFDNDAQDIFEVWFEQLEKRLRSGKLPDVMASHLSKYRSLMPSLALIFEAINNDDFCVERLSSDLLVSAQSAQLAIDWVQYLECVARDIFTNDTDVEIDHAILLAGKIAGRIESGKITDKMPMRAIKRMFKSKKDTEYLAAALDMLQENDWLTIEIVKTKGRSSTILSLNPVFATPNQSVTEVLPITPPKQPIEETQKTVTEGTKVLSVSDKDITIKGLDNNSSNVHIEPKGGQFVQKGDFTLCQKNDSECQKIDDIDTQSTNPPPVIQAQASNGQGKKAVDPNKHLTQQIKQYLKKNGTGSLDTLVGALGNTKKAQQAVREHIDYLSAEGVIGTYDNQSGYVSVFFGEIG